MNKAYKMRWLVILLLSSVMNKMQIYAKRPGHYHLSIRRQQNQHTNISKLLDKLLENYVNFFAAFMCVTSDLIINYVCMHLIRIIVFVQILAKNRQSLKLI